MKMEHERLPLAELWPLFSNKIHRLMLISILKGIWNTDMALMWTHTHSSLICSSGCSDVRGRGQTGCGCNRVRRRVFPRQTELSQDAHSRVFRASMGVWLPGSNDWHTCSRLTQKLGSQPLIVTPQPPRQWSPRHCPPFTCQHLLLTSKPKCGALNKNIAVEILYHPPHMPYTRHPLVHLWRMMFVCVQWMLKDVLKCKARHLRQRTNRYF